jgi:hypothetical protein
VVAGAQDVDTPAVSKSPGSPKKRHQEKEEAVSVSLWLCYVPRRGTQQWPMTAVAAQLVDRVQEWICLTGEYWFVIWGGPRIPDVSVERKKDTQTSETGAGTSSRSRERKRDGSHTVLEK